MVLPLQGIRVLDLSRLLPGPYCSQMLADFGADVIKVEDTDRGDYLRDFPPCVGKRGALFESVNRNKKSIRLDLKQDAGKMAFRLLAKKSDVILEGFRPGVMDKLGLGYEALKKDNPGLIFCAITGYGQDGPYALIGGHDVNYLSYAGISGLMGERGAKPAMGDIQVADIGGGALMAVIGILLALQARTITGKGQFCDVSMMDGAVAWLPFVLARFGAGEKPARGSGLLSGGYACYHIYQTQDGCFVSLGAIEDKFWMSFCRLIGREEFIPLQMKVEAQAVMIEELNALFLQKSQAGWVAFFAGHDICFSPVNDLEQVVQDPQIVYRRMVVSTGEAQEKTLLTGIPIKLSETPGEIRGEAPGHGEHTKQILMEAGYSEEEVNVLAAKGVI